MFKNLFNPLSKDIGIDVGSDATLIYTQEKGIVVQEPSVVAINTNTEQIVAVGRLAKEMIGKTPAHMMTVKPLVDGVVSDFEVTEKMLKHFINEIHRETFSLMPRPRVVVAVPLDITEVERKAVQDAVMGAGAREAYLIEAPMAAAIGARLPIQDATGQLIVDHGAGITNIAVIALGGIVSWKALRLGGDTLNRDIINYVRDHCQLLLGERTAEHLKMTLGTANVDEELLEAKVRGRDMMTGLPREMMINNQYIREAMSRSLELLVDAIQQVIEATPPELVADLYERGIVMSGGSAQLRGIDIFIGQRLNIPVRILEDPATSVIRGIGIVLQNIEAAKHLFQMTAHRISD